MLIDDQGGFGGANDILVADGHEVTVVNNEFENDRANLLNFEFLDPFELVIWGARGDGFGTETPLEVATSLESYIQAGGNLLVTGIDSLGSPMDTVLADLVRVTFPDDQASGSAEWSTANRDNFILNGVFGDFRDLSFSAIGFDDDRAIADTVRGAAALAVTPGHSDKIIFTSLPFAGSVGYWNGGESGINTNAQPDFSSGGVPQDIFRNWVAGIRHRRGEGDIGFDTVAPVIELILENNTGKNDADGITSAPIIKGSIMDDSRIVGFRAGFDDTPLEDFSNVLDSLESDGDTTENPETAQFSLETIYFANQPAPGTSEGTRFGFLPHPPDEFYEPRLNNQGQVVFGALLTGEDVTLSNDNGIWFGWPNQLHLIAREGDQAPETPSGTTFLALSVPQFNDGGTIVFQATLAGDDVNEFNDSGIWMGTEFGLRLIVREGMSAPGTLGEADFLSFDPPLINNIGDVVFRASLVGPDVTFADRRGIWGWSSETFRLIVREGAQVPDAPSGTAFENLGNPRSINEDGQFLFSATLRGDAVTFLNDSGIFLASTTQFRTVARKGTQVSLDIPNGIAFDFVSDHALNNNGEVLLTARIKGPGITFSNDSGIWAGSPGELRLVVLAGMQVPGKEDGLKFIDPIQFPRFNDMGQVIFTGGGSIWIDDSGIQREIVRLGGSQVPEAPRGTVFQTIFDRVNNNAGDVIFLASDVNPLSIRRKSTRIWQYDNDTKQLNMVIKTGQIIELAPGLIRSITTLTPFASPTPMRLNEAGKILFEADLSSSDWAFFLASPRKGGQTDSDDALIEKPQEFNENENESKNGVLDFRFAFDLPRLDQINGELLSEGPHTLRLQAIDQFRNISEIMELDFELDTVPPQEPTLDLDPGSDNDPQGDLQTNFSIVTLVGQTDPSMSVELTAIDAIIDDFESHSPFDSIIGNSPSSKPWKRFGPATNEDVRIFFGKSLTFDGLVVEKRVITGNRSGSYGVDWSGVESEFGAIRYQFDGPTDLSVRPLVSVKMFSDNPKTGTLVSLAFGNGTTTFRTDKHVFLTFDTQTLVFKITEPDVFLNEGTESYKEVISNVTEIGFTFTNFFGSGPETIVMDDFVLPIVGSSLSDPRTTVSSPEGNFFFEEISLIPGLNDFAVRATDQAGNQSAFTTRIIRSSPP